MTRWRHLASQGAEIERNKRNKVLERKMTDEKEVKDEPMEEQGIWFVYSKLQSNSSKKGSNKKQFYEKFKIPPRESFKIFFKLYLNFGK